MRLQTIHVLVAACLLAMACAGSQGRRIVVEPHPAGHQTMPREVVSVLLDHGYERVRIREASVDWSGGTYLDATSELRQKQGSTIVTQSEYRMVFRSREQPESFVEARIKRDTGRTILMFFEEDRDGLGRASQGRLQEVKAALVLRHGASRVRTK
ncbi:MAG: hypothetical protein QNJ82_17575 [Gammaproteobacteria bacterium]|nr:hypothetical protein [Gammaproteobacteria bacterium]